MQERAVGHSGKPDPEEEGKMVEPCGEGRGGSQESWEHREHLGAGEVVQGLQVRPWGGSR